MKNNTQDTQGTVNTQAPQDESLGLIGSIWSTVKMVVTSVVQTLIIFFIFIMLGLILAILFALVSAAFGGFVLVLPLLGLYGVYYLIKKYENDELTIVKLTICKWANGIIAKIKNSTNVEVEVEAEAADAK